MGCGSGVEECKLDTLLWIRLDSRTKRNLHPRLYIELGILEVSISHHEFTALITLRHCSRPISSDAASRPPRVVCSTRQFMSHKPLPGPSLHHQKPPTKTPQSIEMCSICLTFYPVVLFEAASDKMSPRIALS